MNAFNNDATNTTDNTTNDFYKGDYLVYILDGCTVYQEIDELVLDLGGTYF